MRTPSTATAVQEQVRRSSRPLAWAAPTAALAPRALLAEGVQAVVDRDLLPLADRAPGDDLDAAAHRVRFAGVVQIAARRQEHSAAVEVELRQVASVLSRQPRHLPTRDDAPVPTAEDELVLAEGSQCEDAFALRRRIAHDDIVDHRGRPDLIETRPRTRALPIPRARSGPLR